MKPRQAFGLSVLVALSLHAVILLVPRIAGRRDPEPPTIEVSLYSLSGPGTAAAQFTAIRNVGAGPAFAPRRRAASPSAPPTAPAAVEPQKGTPAAATTEGTEPAPQSPAAAGDVSLSAGAPSPAAASASAGSDTGAAVMRFGGPGDATGAPGGTPLGAAASTPLAPRPRGEILPVYPRSAKKAGWQGVVTIRAFIDETGRVVSAVVLTSSGHESLDLAALEAVKNTRFDPAVREAMPVSSPLLIPVRFQLN